MDSLMCTSVNTCDFLVLSTKSVLSKIFSDFLKKSYQRNLASCTCQMVQIKPAQPFSINSVWALCNNHCNCHCKCQIVTFWEWQSDIYDPITIGQVCTGQAVIRVQSSLTLFFCLGLSTALKAPSANINTDEPITLRINLEQRWDVMWTVSGMWAIWVGVTTWEHLTITGFLKWPKLVRTVNKVKINPGISTMHLPSSTFSFFTIQ